MEFFLDTASLDEIARWEPLGLVDGVTTNPALLAREGGDPLRQLRAITERIGGPVSAQVTCGDAKEMVVQGHALAATAPNVVVKLPANRAGLEAARALSSDGIECNITLAFDPAQVIAFARVPVAYVSLILGRVEDFGQDGTQRVSTATRMLERMGSPTRLLVASLRNPRHLCAAIHGGADILTVPPSTWDLVFAQPLTSAGADDFARAWESLPEPARRSYERGGEA